MRIRTYSDLHNEFGVFTFPSLKNVDVLCLCGDTSLGTNSIDYLKYMLVKNPHLSIIIVAGNHEYYNNEVNDVKSAWKLASLYTDRLYFLNNDFITIDKQRFFGCTLWTNMNNSNPICMSEAESRMNDYVCIKFETRALKAEDTVEFNRVSYRYLLDNVTKDDIVVTHHKPYVSAGFGRYNDFAYMTDCTELLYNNSPKLWLYGHTHISDDITVNNTRIVSNPRGYANQPNRDFKPNLIIKI